MPAFPYKLHELLETGTSDVELSSIISWLPDGKSFRIHSQEQFETIVLKRYFPRQSQVKSFKRQLQYYDFENFGDGLFSHPCFVRGKRNLCGRIIHQLPTKSQKASGSSVRPPKTRGRKKKSRSSSLTSTSSPSGSLKSRILKAAAEDASVVSFGSDSSLVDAHPSPNVMHDGPSPKSTSNKVVCTLTNIPKFVGKDQQPDPRKSSASAPTMGNIMPTPALSANNMLSLQQQQQKRALVYFQQMQAMQMAGQQYLFSLQQEVMLMKSMLQNDNVLLRQSTPYSGHALLPTQGAVAQHVPSSIFDSSAAQERMHRG